MPPCFRRKKTKHGGNKRMWSLFNRRCYCSPNDYIITAALQTLHAQIMSYHCALACIRNICCVVWADFRFRSFIVHRELFFPQPVKYRPTCIQCYALIVFFSIQTFKMFSLLDRDSHFCTSYIIPPFQKKVCFRCPYDYTSYSDVGMDFTPLTDHLGK